MAEIKIRKAVAGDVDDILRLNMELDKEEIEKYDADWDLDWILSKGRTVIGESLADGDNYVIVAEVGDKIVGFFRASLYRENFDWMSWRKGQGAEIWDIFVEKDFRGQKIGGKFMESFLEWVKTKKVDYILAGVADKNREAENYYKKFGFKNNLIFMEKKLK